jgi:hypothetical protein
MNYIRDFTLLIFLFKVPNNYHRFFLQLLLPINYFIGAIDFELKNFDPSYF